MIHYNITQWILILFIYCFLGWVWETSYVSIKKRHFTNRGFMHGPFLPIYGFGAIAILFSTLPVADNLFLVFLFGMLSSTVLEFVTGEVMMALFHVRYWDYSNQKFNFRGQICLTSSLAWGGFSILLVRVINVPISHLVKAIPDTAAQAIALVLTIVNVADFTMSFSEAIDLRKTLDSLARENENILKLTQNVQQARIQANLARAELRDRAEKLSESARAKSAEVREETAIRLENAKAEHEEKVENERQERAERIENLKQETARKIENVKQQTAAHIENVKQETAEHIENVRLETEERIEEADKWSGKRKIQEASEPSAEMSAKLEELLAKVRAYRPERVKKQILNRNDVVTNEKYKQALEWLRNVKTSREDK